MVEAFYNAALASGGTDNGAPGMRLVDLHPGAWRSPISSVMMWIPFLVMKPRATGSDGSPAAVHYTDLPMAEPGAPVTSSAIASFSRSQPGCLPW